VQCHAERTLLTECLKEVGFSVPFFLFSEIS